MRILVDERGSDVPAGVVLTSLGPDPLHLGPTAADPALLVGQSGKTDTNRVTCATGQTCVAEVALSAPPPFPGAAAVVEEEPSGAPEVPQEEPAAPAERPPAEEPLVDPDPEPEPEAEAPRARRATARKHK